MTGAESEAARVEQAAIIARQNDRFRAFSPWGIMDQLPGKIIFTPGILALGPEFLTLLQLNVAGFDDFTQDNDPWGDHSFGVVEICGVRTYWKIDLFNEAMDFAPDDPTDAQRTFRVLTLLLPSEY